VIDPAQQDELTEPLGILLERALGTPVRVDGLHKLSGGASRETWSFDAVEMTSGGTATVHPLVLQRNRGGAVGGIGGLAMALEGRLVDVAARYGVPVAESVVDTDVAGRVLASTPDGGARIARRVEGETLGRRIVRDDRFSSARAVLVDQCATALARIHSIDPGEVPGLRLSAPVERLRLGLDLLDEARPVFELALRWLDEHRRDPGPAAVVHGDFRLGNLVVGDDGLRAVLDWELAHLGDPLEDLGWLCVRAWRFGGASEVAGIGELDQLVESYSSAVGREVDSDAVRWWIVAGTLTWGLICAVQARRHLDGHVRSVELATIGRRVCESEYDLLALLGLPVPPEPTPVESGQDLTGHHGRPTAAELVAAVREHLEQHVAPSLEGASAFNLKVAVNALHIITRELELGPEIDAAHVRRLESAGFDDERALASAIREGRALDRSTIEALSDAVIDRLRVANPRWFQDPA
jgi:aminoglycoside phosphotransferase (APT) family kinase protein